MLSMLVLSWQAAAVRGKERLRGIVLFSVRARGTVCVHGTLGALLVFACLLAVVLRRHCLACLAWPYPFIPWPHSHSWPPLGPVCP